ncbi:MAG TPA: trigger factor [Polyangiales bacterium]|nr:trigger factor [Polyangiales bacterium]
MQSQLETLSPVLVQVKVEVPWQKVNEDLETAYKAMQRKARIRGFRPGRVPRDVVKNVLGKSIRSEVTQELVRQGIGYAVEEHKLDPVAYQDLSPAAINDGEPLRFTARLEVRPKIEQVDSSGIEVERVALKIADEAIAAEIDRLREQGAELITPEPARASQTGDTITFDVRVDIDGESQANMDASERRAELGKGNLLPELDAGLTGVSIGEERDITVSFPADYGYEELRGKTAVFHASLKNIQTKVLPEADDEFAKDLGESTLESLRASVRDRLEKTARERSDSEVRDAVVEKLVDKNPVPVPPSLIEQETRSMLEQYVRIQYMLRQEPKLNEEVQENFKRQAERKVRAGLLFGAIARAENISVTPEDVEAKLAEIAERTGKHIAKVRAEHQEEQRRNLELQILEKKLLEYLVSRATIRDVEAKPEATQESQEATP